MCSTTQKVRIKRTPHNHEELTEYLTGGAGSWSSNQKTAHLFETSDGSQMLTELHRGHERDTFSYSLDRA
jgi:hypothetical protein